MASEIRVNKINSSTGVGTITLSPTGVDISGITTVSTLKVGTGVTASEDGDIFFTGVCTATTFTGAHSGSGANLTALPAANLTGTLPAISAANLTNVPAANITGTLPAISAANLTNVPAANITGTLPAITAANLTNIPAANIVGVCTAGLTRTGGFGGGKIIQFQYGAADSGDHSSASSGGEGADVSGLTTSITLTSSSNKVLVMVSCNPYVGGSGAARYALKLFRDSTMVFEETYANMRESDGTTKATRTSYTYLDNPADTSAHTYKVALKKESGSNTVYLFNEGANAHTISLYEVDVS